MDSPASHLLISPCCTSPPTVPPYLAGGGLSSGTLLSSSELVIEGGVADTSGCGLTLGGVALAGFLSVPLDGLLDPELLPSAPDTCERQGERSHSETFNRVRYAPTPYTLTISLGCSRLLRSRGQSRR